MVTKKNAGNGIEDACAFLKSFVYASLMRRKYPKAIRWLITEKCNQKCLYCSGQKNNGQELSTLAVFGLIKEMEKAGIKYISFTGGEPLLREDLGEIIDFAAGRRIVVKINTNGFFLKARIKELRNTSIIHLSLDGNREINDSVRGGDSFDKAVMGLESAIEENIPVYINSVISKLNVKTIENILGICLRYKVGVYFQPSRMNIFGEKSANPVAPEPDEYKQAVQKIMLLKKTRLYGKIILNSARGLEYLSHWPLPEVIPCFAGLTVFRLDAKGILYPCNEMADSGINAIAHGLAESIKKISYSPCRECWCANLVEYNFMMSLNLNALRNFFFTKQNL
ncbi:MAG: radical SAM protein [Candidatus Omnitrophica bacterium]|nr:radical SAM protein [Candidatus Omnitrophota bacterium]